MTDEHDAPEQLRLILPTLSDVQMRDQRETMERPFFSLAKSKRITPIEYESPDGSVRVHVSANPQYGMATIWDADILIYLASVITALKNEGRNDIPQTIEVKPAHLLRRIGRTIDGRSYELLCNALDRLQSTTVKTNIRSGRRKEITFSWIDSWSHIIDEREENKGMRITMARWFYEGVMMDGGVLAIDPEYFNITGGRDRWLYRVARKHAGAAGPDGFEISFPTLYEKSGSEGPYRRFKFEMLKVARENRIPGFRFEVIETGAEPKLRMIRVDSKPGRASKPARRSSRPSPTDVTRTISDAAIAQLREECPGWDYDNLRVDYDAYIARNPERMPHNYERGFIGWVRRYHEKNKHSLPGIF